MVQPRSRRDFLRTAALSAAWPASAQSAAPDPNLVLWYKQPAPDWNEALPVGNGHLGAMVFGGVATEHLQLNENTLYSGAPGDRDLPLDVAPDFEEVERLLRARQFAEAADLISRKWCGRAQDCYQPLGDLEIEFSHAGAASGYSRSLDLANAVASVKYSVGGVEFTREVFASHPANWIVVRLTAAAPGALTFRAKLSSVHPTAKTAAAGAREIVMTGQAPGVALRRTLEWVEQRNEQWKYPEIWDKNGKRRPFAKPVLYGDEVGGRGLKFEARLRAVAKDGTVTAAADGLRVEGASEVVLVLAAATGTNRAQTAGAVNYAKLREQHVADYRKLFDRCSIDLGRSEQSLLPTDERIAKFKNDRDPALATLYFNFARYLTIAASRPGGQPLNLQGMWNREVIPPWASAYTTNINAQMNYWPTEAANLPECAEPLLHMIRELSVTGREVASRMYHRRGWVVHHNTTIWRDAQPVDNNAMPSFWNMAGGWFCEHIWDHYLFTGDRAFLTGFYPVLRGAAEFYSDWLVDDGRGHLVTAAGNSPENIFIYRDASGKEKTAGICMGPTMDIAIIRELFANCIRAAEILKRDEDFRRELQAKLNRLLPYQIGARGQLQEWPEDFAEREPQHRHISHLYGLHPSNQISRRKTPDLAKAAQRTLELRGDEGTGWSRAWKINHWARLEDGNHAYKLVRNLFTPAKTGEVKYSGGGVLPNLFCSHPPFQIDGNFGGAAGILEMLLQSHAGEVHLLPALPDAWPQGEARGLCARGGFEIDLRWSGGKLTGAAVRSKLGAKCRVRYGDLTEEFETMSGRQYQLNGKLVVA